ncbi:Proteasome assembly chaperone (PAC2) family protein [Nocardiopsis flavescens]|uniref:Proteasome assembly chaperone (PAC2) family protein n=1 Tax=Nocardiopsis flavescens TaxID=758803 RepID=A0A1M6WHR8_9ACTN|nr:PAC2 family protein [Nocardiopsis flavescens]SHK93323.1 Proteasome assembly chaperone (PAC2) family protein [Nocardiopsis flavescens]
MTKLTRELVDPVLVAAFEGWNDAGEAASLAVEHLAREWDAHELCSLTPDDYYDFQVTRPRLTVVDGQVGPLEWPTTSVRVARMPGGRDVVLVTGPEPNMRWRSYAADLLSIARELGVRRAVMLGSLLADAPHTRPIPVTGMASPRELGAGMSLEPTTYSGPTGIVGVVHEAFSDAGIEAVSLWAAIPHYVAQPPCPKATLALLAWVEDFADVKVPLGSLPEDAVSWEAGVNDLTAEDEEIAAYVRGLEEAKDTADLPEASGDAIAREFERYLRHRDDD